MFWPLWHWFQQHKLGCHHRSSMNFGFHMTWPQKKNWGVHRSQTPAFDELVAGSARNGVPIRSGRSESTPSITVSVIPWHVASYNPTSRCHTKQPRSRGNTMVFCQSGNSTYLGPYNGLFEIRGITHTWEWQIPHTWMFPEIGILPNHPF